MKDDAITVHQIKTTNPAAQDYVLSYDVSTGLDWVAPATITVTNLSITDAKLAANSVITSKIKDRNVTQAKIALLAVDTAQLATDSVTLPKIDTASAGSANDFLKRTATGLDWDSSTVADNSITHTKLAAGSVGRNNLITVATLTPSTTAANNTVLASNGSSMGWVKDSSVITTTDITWNPSVTLPTRRRASVSGTAKRIGDIVFFSLLCGFFKRKSDTPITFNVALPYGTSGTAISVVSSSNGWTVDSSGNPQAPTWFLINEVSISSSITVVIAGPRDGSTVSDDSNSPNGSVRIVGTYIAGVTL